MGKYTNLGKVMYMNVILTFHLSQCLALASLLPQIAEQNNYNSLGQVGLICIYTVNLVFNLIAPLYLTKWKYRTGFLFQALLVLPCFISALYVSRCDANNIKSNICNEYLLYPVTIIGCIFLGAGLGGYFVLQNTYVSDCTNEQNKELYFGITYMLLGCSYLLNGLTSDQLLSKIGRENFFFYSGSMELILSLFFFLVLQPQKENLSSVSDLKVNLYPDSEIQKQNDKVNQNFAVLSFKEQLLSIKEKFQHNEMKYLFSLFISTGIVIGFEFGIFHKFITASLPNQTKEVINLKTARIFLFVGVAQIISGILNGLSRFFVGIIQNSIFYGNIFQFMIIVAFISAYSQNYVVNILLGLLIGLTDNSGQFNSAVIISDIWNEDMAIFGLYLFCQNFGVMFINLIAIIIDGLDLGYYLIVLIIFQCMTSFSQQKFMRTFEKK